MSVLCVCVIMFGLFCFVQCVKELQRIFIFTTKQENGHHTPIEWSIYTVCMHNLCVDFESCCFVRGGIF